MIDVSPSPPTGPERPPSRGSFLVAVWNLGKAAGALPVVVLLGTGALPEAWFEGGAAGVLPLGLAMGLIVLAIVPSLRGGLSLLREGGQAGRLLCLGNALGTLVVFSLSAVMILTAHVEFPLKTPVVVFLLVSVAIEAIALVVLARARGMLHEEEW